MPNPQKKVSNSEVDEISTKINESAEKIKAELNYLLKISADSQNLSSTIERPFSEFRSAGFRASIFKKIGFTADCYAADQFVKMSDDIVRDNVLQEMRKKN